MHYTTTNTDIFMGICIVVGLVAWLIVRSVSRDKDLDSAPLEEEVLDFPDDDMTE